MDRFVRLLTILSLVTAAGTASGAVAAPADLDAGFGIAGIAMVPPIPIPQLEVGPKSPVAIAVQADGKVLLGIAAYHCGGFAGCFQQPFALIRYNNDGSVDPSFGQGGVVTDADYQGLLNLLVQADGKIVLAGITPGNSGSWLLRIDASGAPDSTFGNGGSAAVSPGMLVYALTQQLDGKLLVAGILPSAEASIAVARFDVDGQPDGSYGVGGIASQAVVGGSISQMRMGIALQGDGKIVVVGTIGGTPHGADIFIARFDATGNPDPGFAGGSGVLVTAFTDSATHYNIAASAVRELADRTLVVAGSQDTLPDFGAQMALLHLNADGSIDDSFGSYGRAFAHLGPGISPDFDPVVASDGSAIFPVSRGSSLTPGSFLTRMTAAGLPDASFGQCGTTTFGASNHLVVALQPDGKVLVSGFALPSGAPVDESFGLARLIGTGGTSVLLTDQGPNPARAGAAIAMSARVIGASSVAGTVTFTDSGTLIPGCASVPVAASQASCQAQGLGVGPHTLAASYAGDAANPAATSCPVVQFVDPSDRATAIEYYHTVFDHYFITTIPDEVAALDSGVFPGWSRTGQSFGVHPLDQMAGSLPVCRFFSGQRFAPKSSHFYTDVAAECASLKQGPDWLYEGVVFGLDSPSPSPYFYCNPPQVPLYRIYNNGQGGAPNHRLLTDQFAFGQLVYNYGWVAEALSTQLTFACVSQ